MSPRVRDGIIFVAVVVLCVAFLAEALSAQTVSQRRIPVGKEKKAHADTVRLVRVDTVRLVIHDTVSIFQAAALPPAPPVQADSQSCSTRYIPIPIPIPLPRGHGSGTGGSTGSPVTATPEPGTWLLMGTGLAAVAYIKRRR